MKQSICIFLALVLSLSFTQAQSPDYIFVFLNKKPDKAELPEDEVKKIMDGHMANINRLANEGKLLAAGPFEGGGGIFIFNSNSVDQVRDWVQTDPGVQAKRWNIEILPYYVEYGSVCKVGEPYQMVTYQFIRYATHADKKSQSKWIRKHKQYLASLRKTASIVTEATFNNTDGILIVNGELPDSTIKEDPAILHGALKTSIQKLWIARGAFCEK